MDLQSPAGKVKLLRLIGVFLLALSLVHCAQPTKVEPVSEMDNPWHHYGQGMNAIDEYQDYQTAGQKFNRAITLDKSFSPGIAGNALVAANTAAQHKDAEHRKIDVTRALTTLNSALSNAESNAEKYIANVAGIRVYTQTLATKNWLREAEDHYEKSVKLEGLKMTDLPHYKSQNAAHYFMATACWNAGEFRKAESMLVKVQQSGGEGKWHLRTSNLYKRVQKVVRVSSNYTLSGIAKKIAVLDQVSRADVAAILVDELKLDKLFGKKLNLMGQQLPAAPEFIPADILSNQFKSEISTILKWKVKGLEPMFDKMTRAPLFKPELPVKRKSLAFILQDVLIKITGDKTIATKMIGNTSPHPDVLGSAPWFNAVMTATSRGLMEADITSRFDPDRPADGAELLLATFQLRRIMNIH